MKHSFIFLLAISMVFLYACKPDVKAPPAIHSSVTITADTAEESQTSAADPAENKHTYTNDAFGIRFEYPAGWYGPDIYTADQTLRVAVGSDVVYPYGTDRSQQIYQQTDAYYVTIQYEKGGINAIWKETLDTLSNLQDGQSISDPRGMLIRVRALDTGALSGFEYITTLSETAQTEPFYMRQALLMDDEESRVLIISGSPNNVQIGSEGDWRSAYQQVDLAFQPIFEEILASVRVD